MVEPRAESPAIRRLCRCANLEAVARRYMQEMIPFVSPQTDVMAPRHGDQ